MDQADQTANRILLVDDDEMFRLSTAALLSKAGYLCDPASCVTEACALLQRAPYSLLISDINMPGNLQLEFINYVSHLLPQLPILLVTGSAIPPFFGSPVELQTFPSLVKPFSFDTLRLSVRTILENLHQRQLPETYNAPGSQPSAATSGTSRLSPIFE